MTKSFKTFICHLPFSGCCSCPALHEVHQGHFRLLGCFALHLWSIQQTVKGESMNMSSILIEFAIKCKEVQFWHLEKNIFSWKIFSFQIFGKHPLGVTEFYCNETESLMDLMNKPGMVTDAIVFSLFQNYPHLWTKQSDMAFFLYLQRLFNCTRVKVSERGRLLWSQLRPFPPKGWVFFCQFLELFWPRPLLLFDNDLRVILNNHFFKISFFPSKTIVNGAKRPW